MNSKQKNGEAALALAAILLDRFEGFRSHPYRDQRGIWTIGIGTIAINGQPVTGITTPISEDFAKTLAALELRTKLAGLNIPDDLPTNQLAALLSITYNEGLMAINTSTLLWRLRQGDVQGAADQFLVWNKVRINGELVVDQGLVNRRAAERDVFLGAPA
jgi:lysozyme